MIFPGDTAQPGALGAGYGIAPYTVVPGSTPTGVPGTAALDPSNLATSGASQTEAGGAIASPGMGTSASVIAGSATGSALPGTASAAPVGTQSGTSDIAGVTTSPAIGGGLVSGSAPPAGGALDAAFPSSTPMATQPASYAPTSANSIASASTGQIPAVGSTPPMSFDGLEPQNVLPTGAGTTGNAILPGVDGDADSLRAVMSILKGAPSA